MGCKERSTSGASADKIAYFQGGKGEQMLCADLCRRVEIGMLSQTAGSRDGVRRECEC